MRKIFKVEGMMCPKCAQSVKDALAKVATVETANHETGEVVIAEQKIEDQGIINIIESLYYEVKEIVEQ